MHNRVRIEEYRLLTHWLVDRSVGKRMHALHASMHILLSNFVFRTFIIFFYQTLTLIIVIMNNSTSNFIVRLRGLPYSTNQNEIRNFLQGFILFVFHRRFLFK